MSELSFDSVAIRYGDRLAVDHFHETVATGEWLGLIGPNGAGKSSLIRAVAGIVDHGGSIAVDGDPLGTLSAKERARRVAYVAQNPIIPVDMTTFEFVLLGRWPHVGRFGVEGRGDRRVVDAVLDRLRLGPFRDRRLGELSGGERQRVVLARALAQEAPVLLLDEPTSALDIGHQQQALELVTELRCDEQMTVVAAMHDLTLASIYADRLVMLDRGEVVATGAARDVLTAERLGEVYHVCVTVDIDPDDGAVVVVPRRGFPVS